MTFLDSKAKQAFSGFSTFLHWFVIRFACLLHQKRSHWVVCGRQTVSDDYHSVLRILFLMMYYIILSFFFMSCMFCVALGRTSSLWSG